MENMKSIIKGFDQYLNSKQLKFEAIVIGGAALNLMDVTTRLTKDVDLIDPEIPQEIKEVSISFLKEFPNYNLKKDWLNNGPIALVKDLPKNWKNRIQLIFQGLALTFYTLGRIDLLKTKIYALCDRSIDFEDCIQLRPSKKEIDECISWVKEGDGNPMWPQRVDEMILELKKELGLI